jgi:hypothetical protein
MINKKIICLAIAGSLMISSSVFAKETSGILAASNPILISENIVSASSPTVITSKTIKSESEYAKINIRIPKVHGLKDTVYEQQLNHIIESHAMEDKEKIEKDSKQSFEDAEKYGWTTRPYELMVDYSVKNVSGIMSFTVITYTYTGGANGFPRLDTYNVDIKESKRLALSHLFKNGSDYKTIINNEISQQIKYQQENEDKVYFEGDMGFKGISEEQGFYIQNNNLVVTFSKYSIAPGVMGNPEFNIPLYKLSSILKDSTPLILDNTYYNYKYNFSFRIPPIWKDKVRIEEAYDTEGSNVKVDFIYTPKDKNLKEEKLLTISVLNTKDSQTKGYVIAETEAYFYDCILSKQASYEADSTDYKEYRKLLEALDGIDDLFKVVNVKEELEAKQAKAVENVTVFDKVIINGEEVSLQKSIYKNENGIVMVPLRQISEKLGYNVVWNSKKKSAELSKGAQWTLVKVGEDSYNFAKMFIKLGAAPELKSSATYVPVHFLEQVLKAEVELSDKGIISVKQ